MLELAQHLATVRLAIGVGRWKCCLCRLLSSVHDGGDFPDHILPPDLRQHDTEKAVSKRACLRHNHAFWIFVVDFVMG